MQRKVGGTFHRTFFEEKMYRRVRGTFHITREDWETNVKKSWGAFHRTQRTFFEASGICPNVPDLGPLGVLDRLDVCFFQKKGMHHLIVQSVFVKLLYIELFSFPIIVTTIFFFHFWARGSRTKPTHLPL